MITTSQPILKMTSDDLNEQAVDTSSKRFGYFNTAVRHVLSLYKWGWARKKDTITLSSANEYDLTSLLDDYDVSWGIHSVEDSQGRVLGSVDFSEKGNFTSTNFTLTPDHKKLYVTNGDLGSGAVLTIWYYATHQEVDAANDTLNIPIPESVAEAVSLYMQFKVHKGKRQRYDSRNAILDFKEKIDTLRPQEASNKARNMPKLVPNYLASYRRRYRY